MMVSTKHNFIFIHIPKTAGTSIREILAPYCIQPVSSKFRKILSHLPIPEDPVKARFRIHSTAAWARFKYGQEFFDSNYRFAVVRNPYDWGVSFYHYKMRKGRYKYFSMKDVSYKKFLKWHQRGLIPEVSQSKQILDTSGNILVNDLYHFENIDEEIKALGLKLGIEFPPLPKVNVTKHKHYSEYYDDETKHIFDEVWEEDIKLLGYSFETGT